MSFSKPFLAVGKHVERASRCVRYRRFMIVLGVILLIAGFVLKIPVVWAIGVVLLVIGAVLAILGAMGRAVGGRRHYY